MSDMRRISRGILSAISAAAGACAFFGSTPAVAGCWASSTGVSFGIYDPQAVAPVDTAGSITLECDRREPSATVSVGAGTSGSFAIRSMMSGSDTLQYNVFTDASRLQIWGDGSAGTGTINVAPFPNRPMTLTIYGRMPPGQNVRAGSYSDTLIVTIEY